MSPARPRLAVLMRVLEVQGKHLAHVHTLDVLQTAGASC